MARCGGDDGGAARRRRVFEAHDGICGYCEEPIDGPFEIDHPLPLALGGAGDGGGNGAAPTLDHL